MGSESYRYGALATIIALLVNEIVNFINQGGLNNPIALSLFKILVYLTLIAMVYSCNLNANTTRILSLVEGIYREWMILSNRQRQEDQNPNENAVRNNDNNR